ncbi:MAG: hypothetical protein RL033_6923 [Pseudomonadota bacterium]
MKYTPNTREQLRIVLNNYQVFGARQTLRDAIAYLTSRGSDTFDERYGVSTALNSGGVAPLQAGIGEASSLDAGHGYEPSDERVMRNILRFVEGQLDVRRFTFIDFGCGKGRVVLMAGDLPFKEVVGVELAPDHCEVARTNIAAYRASAARQRLAKATAPASIVCADATRFELPKTDLIAYLFNPFRGAVFRTVLERLAAFQRTEGRQVFLILSNPAMEDLIRENAAFAKRHEVQVISAGNSWNFWECQGASGAAN